MCDIAPCIFIEEVQESQGYGLKLLHNQSICSCYGNFEDSPTKSIY